MPHMQKFTLCRPCASRFPKNSAIAIAQEEGSCLICAGALSKIPSLLSSALSQSSLFEWGSFAVSSSFPKAAMVQEQKVADFFQPGDCTSMKNSVNAALSSRIALATKKKNSARAPDAIFEFDFARGTASAKPSDLYIHGHYLKLSRNFCQSRWHCSACRGKGCNQCRGSGMNYPSVEDELGKVFCAAFEASACTLHASGREDVDVRSLGSGRPFVMALSSPKKREADLKMLEAQLAQNPSVRATRLRKVGKGFIDAVCNSHFEKEYSALVRADRPLGKQDAQAAESLSGQLLLQKTPNRVLSRRADLQRKRKIISISAEPCEGGKLRLRILAEAGTYIKELISSDGGRTEPSLSSVLGCKAECEELDVIFIHDYFLETIKSD
jgi:tRNA pseudouridine synthase 10